jgi:hypothetical protein
MLLQCFTLEKQLQIFSELFDKPMRYVIYPTITYNYSKPDYSPPTDRLIMATLSIASNSSDGLVIWRDADNPVIQKHMENRQDKRYLLDISNSKELQIGNENIDTEISQLSQRIFIIHVIVGPKDMMRQMTSGSNYPKGRITMTGKGKFFIN